MNTQRREDARKRATDHLAWRLVAGQLEGDPERRDEALGHVKTSADRLDREIRRAFQHFAFLVRGTERIEVEWKRFDDDNSSSLQGNHVWATLAEAGRATTSAGVSGVYLGTLLERMARDLTLKEIVQQFYKNPVFPLVRNADEIRTAIFDLTRSGWAVMGPDGPPLEIRNRADLSIGSMDQTIRKYTPVSLPPGRPEGHTQSSDSGEPFVHTEGTAGPGGRTYRRGTAKLPNQSVVSPDARLRATDLLWAFYDALEPANRNDIQLLDATLAVTAEEQTLEKIRLAAEKAGAQWREEDIDF